MNPLVKNKMRGEAFDVYVGRPSRWGNPFSHLYGTQAKYQCATREQAIEEHRQWLWREIRADRITLTELAELDGKRLGCWCAPKACHAETLTAAARWAVNRLKEGSSD